MVRKRRNNMNKTFLGTVKKLPNEKYSYIPNSQKDELVKLYKKNNQDYGFEDLICMIAHFYLKQNSYHKGRILMEWFIEKFDDIKPSDCFGSTEIINQRGEYVLFHSNFFLRHIDRYDYHFKNTINTELYEQYNFLLYDNNLILPRNFIAPSLLKFMEL